MSRPAHPSLQVRIGDSGQAVAVRGREVWALLMLQAAGDCGCTPLDTPGPRWSGYVHDLRKLGLVIETINEPHTGCFPGTHARYVLRSRITIVEQVGEAA